MILSRLCRLGLGVALGALGAPLAGCTDAELAAILAGGGGGGEGECQVERVYEPRWVQPGGYATIQGKNLPEDGDITATVGGLDAQVLARGGSSITVRVPEGVGVGPTPADITVNACNKQFNVPGPLYVANTGFLRSFAPGTGVRVVVYTNPGRDLNFRRSGTYVGNFHAGMIAADGRSLDLPGFASEAYGLAITGVIELPEAATDWTFACAHTGKVRFQLTDNTSPMFEEDAGREDHVGNEFGTRSLGKGKWGFSLDWVVGRDQYAYLRLYWSHAARQLQVIPPEAYTW